MKTKTMMTILALSISGAIFAQETPPEETPTNNACTNVAEKSLLSCQTQADSDNQLAVALCQNLDEAQIEGCTAEAENAKTEAVALCSDQNKAQLEACARLGGEAYNPTINPGDFTAEVTNKYFPLPAGSKSVFQGNVTQGAVTAEIAPTGETKDIAGVTTTEVKRVTTLNNIVVNNTFDYFAQDIEGNVWIFSHVSQDVSENGQVTSLEGWTSGESGAKPAIFVKATPEVGNIYRSSYALQTSEKTSEVQSLTEELTTAAGNFSNVLKVKVLDAVQPTAEANIFFAENVGPIEFLDVKTNSKLDLVERTPAPTQAPPEEAPVPEETPAP